MLCTRIAGRTGRGRDSRASSVHRDAAVAKNIGEAFDYAAAPRLEIGIRQVETPTAFQSSGCGAAPAAPDDFTRLAELPYLRSLGVEVARPAWPQVFGHDAAGAGAGVGLLTK